jgi:hypothetical protein
MIRVLSDKSAGYPPRSGPSIEIQIMLADGDGIAVF